MSRRLVAAVVAVAAVVGVVVGLVLSGGGDETPVSAAPSAAATPGSTPAAEPSTTPSAEPAESAEPSAAVSSRRPVPIGDTVPMTPDVTVSVSKVTAVEVEARGPGEIAGPGVRVVVVVENGGSKPFDLGSLAVNATYGRGTPAAPSESGGSGTFAGDLAPGGVARATFVFSVPEQKRDTVRVDVSSSLADKIAVFRS